MRLRHYENEAAYANYNGFHRWNFMEVSGEGIIFSQNTCWNIRSLAHPCAVLAYESMKSLKDDGSHRRMAEFAIVKPLEYVDLADSSFGVSLQVSSCRRSLKLTRHNNYNSTYPMFIHLHHKYNSILSTTLVWENTEDRTIPLFDSSTAASLAYRKIAIGQYDFTEGHNHYAPNFENQWYLEFEL
jgi:hypothetical protein